MVGLLALVGCPGIEKSEPPVKTCVAQYTRCKLPTGPIGVCDFVKCTKGAPPPCLRCMPQH